MKNCLYLIFTTLFVACQSPKNSEKSQIDSTKIVVSEVVKTSALYSSKVEKQFGFLKKVYQKDEKWLIDIDYIQFLSGDEAIKAARKHGEAEMDIDAKKDTTYWVPNDYYIVNDNKKIRTFEFASSAKIGTLDVSNTGMEEHSGLEYLVKVFKKKTNLPFLLKIDEGKIIELKEQFIP